MKKNWTKIVFAKTTRKVAGHVVRKTAKTVIKKNVSNITKDGIFLANLRIKVPPFAIFDIFSGFGLQAWTASWDFVVRKRKTCKNIT